MRSLEQEISRCYVAPGQREVLCAEGTVSQEFQEVDAGLCLCFGNIPGMPLCFGILAVMEPTPTTGRFPYSMTFNVAYNVLLEQPGVDPTCLALGHIRGQW